MQARIAFKDVFEPPATVSDVLSLFKCSNKIIELLSLQFESQIENNVKEDEKKIEFEDMRFIHLFACLKQ